MLSRRQVWVFNGGKGRFPGAIFEELDLAETWIRKHRLSGVLTAYPLNEGCFEWAIANNCTNLSPEKLAAKGTDSDFIGAFTSASQEHFHYEDGTRV